MANIREILSKNIKKYRQKLGITQSELAELADISPNFIGMIEQKRKFAAPEVLDRIAAALKIETSELFIDKLNTPEEMEQVYQKIGKNIDQLIRESIEKHYQVTAKNIEQIVSGSIEKAFSEKHKCIKMEE
jgi:transcriptional regulator with XRE-family HTH domain